jgi:hypothetical protein
VRQQRGVHGRANHVSVRSDADGHGLLGQVRSGFERLWWHLHVPWLHRAANLRRWRNPQHLWLHPDSDGHGVQRQKLQCRFERLRRDVHMRLVHGPSNLRWRRRRQCLRLHQDAHGHGVQQR